MDKKKPMKNREESADQPPYFLSERFQAVEGAYRLWRHQARLLAGFCLALCLALIMGGYQLILSQSEWVYLLGPEGQAATASRSSEPVDLAIEAEDQVIRFHQLFFDLEPDGVSMEGKIQRALAWGDESVGKEYRNLVEKDYFRLLIRLRIRQRLHVDSVSLFTTHPPLGFRFYGRLEIIRVSGTRYRTLVTQGNLKKLGRSKKNPHGLMITHWQVLENQDIPSMGAPVDRRNKEREKGYMPSL